MAKKPTKKTPAKKSVKPVNGKTIPKAPAKLAADGGVYKIMWRSELKPADYNPRQITPNAARRLRESIRLSGGLVQPPIWNTRTGSLVGGHQRLAQMDVLQADQGNTSDYQLTVCVVDLSPQQEIETNIRLNSPQIAGEYDVEALDELLAREDIDIGHTGLDMGFLEDLHIQADMDLPEWMLDPEDREAQEALEDDGIIDDMAEALDEVDEAEDEEDEQAVLDEIHRRKAHFNQQEGFNHQSGLSFRVVCPSDGTCEALLKHLGLAFVKGEYVDGMLLAEQLGIKEELQKILKKERPKKLKDFTLEDAETVRKRKVKSK